MSKMYKNKKYFSLYKRNLCNKFEKFNPSSISLVKTKISQFKYGWGKLLVIFSVCYTHALWFSIFNAKCLCWLMLGRSSHFHFQARI